jgi:hypothetical protein
MIIPQALSRFTLNAPATLDETDSLVSTIGPILDEPYAQFIRRHNGGAGLVGKSTYLETWRIGDALKYTKTISDITERLFLFGTDGGDTAYGFDRSDPLWPVMSVSLTSASPENLLRIADSFTDLLQRLAQS